MGRNIASAAFFVVLDVLDGLELVCDPEPPIVVEPTVVVIVEPPDVMVDTISLTVWLAVLSLPPVDCDPPAEVLTKFVLTHVWTQEA
jgi:hypothetical protein